MAEENKVSKNFTAAFVLDKPKLTRLLNILENRFQEANLPFQPLFTVTHDDGREITLGSVEDLLALDNTIKNPISKLEIRVPSNQQTPAPPRVANVRFEDSERRNISLTVIAEDNARVANQIFAEIEEQVERTFTGDLVNKMKSGPSFFRWLQLSMMIIATVVAFLTALTAADSPKYVNETQLQELYDQAKQGGDANSKIEFLFALQSTQFAKDVSATQNWRPNLRNYINTKAFFIALPVLLVFGSLVYLAGWCYPRATFSWGDMESLYKRVIVRRRFVWSVVVFAIIIELIGNMFAFGITNM